MKIIASIAAVVINGGLLTIGVINFLSPDKDQEPELAPPFDNPKTAEKEAILPSPPKLEAKREWTLPVDFPVAELEDGISFETRSSILQRHDNAYQYNLKGILKSVSVEIKKMTADLELIDDGGKVLFRKPFDIIPSHSAAILPGDSNPIKILVFEKGFHGRTSLAVAATDNPQILFPVNEGA